MCRCVSKIGGGPSTATCVLKKYEAFLGDVGGFLYLKNICPYQVLSQNAVIQRLQYIIDFGHQKKGTPLY